MNAIIGEITTFLDEDMELSEKTGELVYVPSIGGFALEAADLFSEKGIEFRLITKLGKDMQGEMHLDMIVREGWAEEEEILYSFMPSSVSVDNSLIIRSTAPASMKKGEILPLLKGVDNVYVSGLLLSFSPVAEEITEAIIENKESIKRVVVSGGDATEILMVETLKESLTALSSKIKECYLVGDILSMDGVKRASSQLVTELFK